jgi:hypothetical protein
LARMKANISPIGWSLAILVAQASIAQGAAPPPAPPPAWPDAAAVLQRFDDAPAAGKEMTQEEFNKAFSQALQMLAANGDQEAFDMIKKAKENGGRLEISKEEAQKFIDRANKVASGADPGGGTEPEKPAEPPKEEEKPKPDIEKVKEAVKALAKKGDKEAQAVIEHARKNRGELKVTDAEGHQFIERAEVLARTGELPEPAAKTDEPAPDPAVIEKGREAVRLLAKKGDKEAKEVVEKARRNRGEITLTEEEAKAFIEDAIKEDLMKEGEPDPAEKMPPQQVKQLIKALAERGDRDAKAIMRKAKKNDGEITYTEEEEKEIIKNAKKEGLIN